MQAKHLLNVNNHKKQIIWKHGPNWPFYALMLRTKLYQNSFVFTGHQNVHKPKSSAVSTVYGPIFLPFYKIIVSFFSFFMSRCKQNKIKLCYNRLQFAKETQLTLYKTQNGESNYVDHKFFFNLYQELPTCTKPQGQASKYYRAGQVVAACIV